MSAFTLFLLFLVSSITSACSAGGETPDRSAPGGGRGRGGPGGAVPVAVTEVAKKAMPLEIQAIGTAEAYSNVAVRAQLTGELTSVNFKEGDDVQEGRVLFTLDRRPLEAALKQAEANLERDLAQAANAAEQAKRYQDLSDRGIATREQVGTSLATASALQATVGADRAAVENARVQIQYATIKAPISGRTGALMVHPGNLVRANDTTPLVVINQVSPIYVSFSIPEAQLPSVRRYLAEGSVRVSAQPPSDGGSSAVGQITFIDNTVDQATGTIKIKALFRNEDRRLWPGQFANVTVTLTTQPDAIVVPAVAVQTGPQGSYVFVVKPDQTVELRPVTVQRLRGAETILAKGVTAGEVVVTDGHLRLSPGSRVSIKAGAPAGAAKSDAPADSGRAE